MKFSFEQKDFIEQEFEANKLAVIAENMSLTWQEFELRVNDLCDFFAKNEWNHLAKPVIIYGHK